MKLRTDVPTRFGVKLQTQAGEITVDANGLVVEDIEDGVAQLMIDSKINFFPVEEVKSGPTEEEKKALADAKKAEAEQKRLEAEQKKADEAAKKAQEKADKEAEALKKAEEKAELAKQKKAEADAAKATEKPQEPNTPQ